MDSFEEIQRRQQSPAPKASEQRRRRSREKQKIQQQQQILDEIIIDSDDNDDDDDDHEAERQMIEIAMRDSLQGASNEDGVIEGDRETWENAMRGDPIAFANEERHRERQQQQGSGDNERMDFLRQRQMDFEASERRDREKDIQKVKARKQAEMERIRKETELKERKRARNSRYQLLIGRLKKEPEIDDGVLFAFRFPNGNKIQRRFNISQQLQDIFDFLELQTNFKSDGGGDDKNSNAIDLYSEVELSITSECPHINYNEFSKSSSLQEVGLTFPTLLSVTIASTATH